MTSPPGEHFHSFKLSQQPGCVHFPKGRHMGWLQLYMGLRHTYFWVHTADAGRCSCRAVRPSLIDGTRSYRKEKHAHMDTSRSNWTLRTRMPSLDVAG